MFKANLGGWVLQILELASHHWGPTIFLPGWLPLGGLPTRLAGRAIGGDRVAHAATRNMACCAVTGQAAGVAAALSLRSNVSLQSLDITPVRQTLMEQGVRVD